MKFSMFGLNYWGLVWLCETVQKARPGGRDYLKKQGAGEIRKALKEAPKKHRQEFARLFCRLMKQEKEKMP